MALFPNLGYGDQPPPQGPRQPILPPLQVDPKDEEKLRPPAPPTGIHSGLNPMVAALQGQQNPAMSGLFGKSPQQLAEYIIRGQAQAPNGPREVIQPTGNDLPAALKAIDRLRLFPNPPGLDPNTLRLQHRL